MGAPIITRGRPWDASRGASTTQSSRDRGRWEVYNQRVSRSTNSSSRFLLRLIPASVGILCLTGSVLEAQTLLTDATEAAGLTFRHWNGRTGDLYFPEMTGQGAALFDFDNDGDLDAYVMQGTFLRAQDRGKTLETAPSDRDLRDRLWRNEGVGAGVSAGVGNSVPRFVDVTDSSKLMADGYGMGVATGDVDGDGFVDLFVANVGANQLWRNRGDGTFEDWTAKAGVAGDARAWSVGGTLADFDRDGHLDLMVIDYVRYDIDKNPTCYATSSRKDYCGPSAFPPLPNSFFHNRGDGTFEDWSTRSGLAAVAGASLGVVAEDLDGDGWLDLYVANDGQANRLWINRRDGTFRDEALLAGVALNREGQPEASMGVTVGDADGDGDADLFMTHLMGETNTLYLNQGGAFFEDRTIEMGLASSSLSFTSFGTGFVDVNADGWLDLVVFSGSVRILEDQVRDGDPFPLGQPNQLLLNQAGRGFIDISNQAGPSFRASEVSRGLALGDVDNDGDVDLLMTNNHGPARLFLVAGSPKRWLGLQLKVRSGSKERDVAGAVVDIRLDGKGSPPSLWRRASTDGSYASASDPRVVVAIPDGRSPSEIRILWPDGSRESFPSLGLGKYHRVVQGSGRPTDDSAAKKPQK